MKKYTIKIDKNTIVPRFIEGDWDLQLTEDQVKDLIAQYNKPTHKRKYFVPKVGEEYYYITYNDHIGCTNYFETGTHNNVKSGNCFATEQDAQDELNRRQALVRIWNNYDDKYSWDIDWSNKLQDKHGIGFNHFRGIPNVQASETIYQYQSELPYFKSAEDRNQFVSENKSDLLVIFNVKTK